MRAAPRLLARMIRAVAFVVVTVALAKAAQYAAVDRWAGAIGFDAASLLGATPVVVAAAIVRYLVPRTHPGGRAQR